MGGFNVRDIALQPHGSRALASESRRPFAPLRVLTNRGILADFSPAAAARALFSCRVRVVLSRTASFREYGHTAATTSHERPDPRRLGPTLRFARLHPARAGRIG